MARSRYACDSWSEIDWDNWRAMPCAACRFLMKAGGLAERCMMHKPAARNTPENPGRRVAPTARTGYSRGSKTPAYRPPDKETNSMAPRTRTAKPAAQAPEPEEKVKDYTVYQDKDITFVMQSFADWLLEEVYPDGYPGDEDDFRKGVSLGGSLRMEFQRSDWWAEVREEHEAEKEAEKKVKPRAAGAKAPRGRGKAAAEPEEPEEEPEELEEEETEEEPEETPAPKARIRRAAAAPAAKAPRRGAAAAATPAKARTTRRGAAAKPAEAPF
jgi:hypothetical protein